MVLYRRVFRYNNKKNKSEIYWPVEIGGKWGIYITENPKIFFFFLYLEKKTNFFFRQLKG